MKSHFAVVLHVHRQTVMPPCLWFFFIQTNPSWTNLEIERNSKSATQRLRNQLALVAHTQQHTHTTHETQTHETQHTKHNTQNTQAGTRTRRLEWHQARKYRDHDSLRLHRANEDQRMAEDSVARDNLQQCQARAPLSHRLGAKVMNGGARCSPPPPPPPPPDIWKTGKSHL